MSRFTASRLPDWERRLGEFVAAHTETEFVWGATDCALWSLEAAEAITGEHPAPEYLGAYSTREGAAEALREKGKGTLVRTMNSLFERRPVGKARRGDLVMVQNAIGICMGNFGLFLTEDEGVTRLHRADFQRAWSIG